MQAVSYSIIGVGLKLEGIQPILKPLEAETAFSTHHRLKSKLGGAHSAYAYDLVSSF
jgi:hypothetical protein